MTRLAFRMGHEEAFREYQKWRQLPEELRRPKTKTAFAKDHNVHVATIINWDKRLRISDIESNTEEVMMAEFMSKTYQMAMSGKSPKWAELWARIKGVYTEKSEVKHDVRITAIDHWKIREQAERELREGDKGAGGDRKMLPQPKILPESIHVVTKQEHSQDSEMARVGLPGRPVGDIPEIP